VLSRRSIDTLMRNGWWDLILITLYFDGSTIFFNRRTAQAQ
jgi:hypothetical protein